MSRTSQLAGKSVFVLDDETTVLEAIRMMLERVGAEPRCFTDAASCLKALRSMPCDLLVADVKMPGMSGLALLREVKGLAPSLPVLLITGYGDVPMAVEALRSGAADLIEKPLEMKAFLSAAESAVDHSRASGFRPEKVLSKVELEVLRLLLAGKTTGEIAKQRHRSIRTIEDERASIMRKLRAKTVIELLRRVADVRLPDVLREQ